MPWSFITAVGLLVLLEIAMRLLPAEQLIPYHVDELESQAVKHLLDARGTADIAIVGSSRTREGVSMPLLSNYVSGASTQQVTIVNYACAGARADLVHTIVENMFESDKHPRLVLYGVSPRQFLSEMERENLSAYFWDFEDWLRVSRRKGQFLTSHLPVVLRNMLGDYSYLIRYRKKAGILLRELLTGRGQISSPLFGQESEWHRRDEGISLLTRPITEDRVKWYVSLFLEKGTNYPQTASKEAHFRETIGLCRQHGVPVVLFEVPTPAILKEHLPRGVYPAFYERIRDVERQEAVPFYTPADLGIELAPEHYLEESHMNEMGARLLSEGLLDRVIAPFLEHQTFKEKGE